MSQIGEKIKELRKENGLTQEQLAKTLGVSYQAVSKWETGVASPDISMLVPLAKTFHVSTDQLLEYKDRRAEFEEIWQQNVLRGDVSKTLEICEAALKEYPHDLTFLYRRACDEYFLADKEITNAERKRKYLESSVRQFKAIISEHPDFDPASGMLIVVLSRLGRHEEAIDYARNHKDKDLMLKYCLTGEDLHKHHQKLVLLALEKLLVELTQYNQPDWLQTAEKIINTIVSDGVLNPVDSFLNKSSVFDAIRKKKISSN